MNICFFIGIICTDVEFKFVLNGKNDSIVRFKIKLSNDSVINVIAYNQLADYCYRKLKINDAIFLEGWLNFRQEIIAEKIMIWRDEEKDERRKNKRNGSEVG